MRGPKPHRLLQAIPAIFQQAPRTGIEPVFACDQRSASVPGARCNDQQLPPRCFNFQEALRPGIAPDQRASKARVASTRRRELSLKEQAPAAGIEPATKRLTVALPYQYRTHRNVKWRETDSNHRPPGYEPGELPTAPSRKAPSGSRTHTSAMARQQATATSWAQNCITTKLSKITDTRGIQRAPSRN